MKSVQELIAYAKANPGKLSFGSGGPGAPHHLYAELLKSMTGIKMTHVPYKGTLPALNDVIAGHIQLMFSDIPPLIGIVAGRQGPADRRVDQGARRGVPRRAAAQRGRRAGLRRRRLVHASSRRPRRRRRSSTNCTAN